MNQLVRHPRGEARHVVDLASVQVPDCWHAAMWLRGRKPAPPGVAEALAKDVLECWYLCHDLLEAIRSSGDQQG